MNTELPLITIITVSYNAAQQISSTIKSLLKQADNRFECIFVDGKSTDNTNKIITNYKQEFEQKNIRITHLIEKDKGIYDAMNKGIKLASSKWIFFLNAGDSFYDSTTIKMINEILDEEDSDIVYGNICEVDNNCEAINVPRSLENMRFELPFCHQAVFTKSELLKNKNFSIKYKIASDYEFFLDAYLNGKKFEYMDVTVARFMRDGVSSKQLHKTYKEYWDIRFEYGVVKSNIFQKIVCLVDNFKITLKIVLPMFVVKRLKKMKLKI